MNNDAILYKLNHLYLATWNCLHMQKMKHGMPYHAKYPPTIIFSSAHYHKKLPLGCLNSSRYWVNVRNGCENDTISDTIPVKTVITFYPNVVYHLLNVQFGKMLPPDAVRLALTRLFIHELTHYDNSVKLFESYSYGQLPYSLYDKIYAHAGENDDEICTERDTIYRLRLYYDSEFDIKKYRYLGIEPGSPLDRRIMLKRIYDNPDHSNACEMIMIWYYSVLYYSQTLQATKPITAYDILINQEVLKMAKALGNDPDARPYSFDYGSRKLHDDLPEIGGSLI